MNRGIEFPEKGTQSQDIGRSRGGVPTKIMALTDAFGNLIDFRLLHGQAHDLRGTAALIVGLRFGSCAPTGRPSRTGCATR